MIISTASNYFKSALNKLICHCRSIDLNTIDIIVVSACKSFFCTDSLSSNNILHRTSLNTRKHCRIYFLGELGLTEYQATPRRTQSFVGGSRHDIRCTKRRRKIATSNKTGRVSDVCHEICSNIVSDLTENIIVNSSTI